jgi:hypothetical protein
MSDQEAGREEADKGDVRETLKKVIEPVEKRGGYPGSEISDETAPTGPPPTQPAKPAEPIKESESDSHE